MDDRGIEKTEDLDDVQGDCNKEKYIQRVVLLEQGYHHLLRVLHVKPQLLTRTFISKIKCVKMR